MNPYLGGECVACLPTPSGLIDWWRFEGNLNSVGPAGDQLTPGSSIYTYGVGKVGEALLSLPTVDNNIDEAGTYLYTNVSLPSGNADRTIECWGKVGPERGGSLATWTVFSLYPTPPTGYGFGLNVNYSDLMKQNTFSPANVIYTSGVWHHTAVTATLCGEPACPAGSCGCAATDVAAGNSSATYYLDGVAIYTGVTLINTSESIFVVAPGTYPEVDEVGVYDRALLPSEIAAIYAAGTDGRCP